MGSCMVRSCVRFLQVWRAIDCKHLQTDCFFDRPACLAPRGVAETHFGARAVEACRSTFAGGWNPSAGVFCGSVVLAVHLRCMLCSCRRCKAVVKAAVKASTNSRLVVAIKAVVGARVARCLCEAAARLRLWPLPALSVVCVDETQGSTTILER